MGQIQSSVGLITGVPIQETVDQLIALAAKPRDQLKARNSQHTAEQTAIAKLTSVILGVQLATNSLGESSLYSSKSVKSSHESLITASVATDGNPAAGKYQFTAARSASGQQLLSSSVASLDTALGAGALSFGRGGFIDQGVRLDTLNAGAGAERGEIRITDRSGTSARIDLRFAQTIDDVLTAINKNGDLQVTASTVGDAIQLTDTSGGSGNLIVAEVSGGTTAAGLGLGGINTAATTATGNDVVSLHESLSLATLNDGNGVSFLDALPDLEVTFADGSAVLEIDFHAVDGTPETTLGDLLETLNNTDPRLSAQISAGGDRIELIDNTVGGGTFTVTSLFGGTAAEDLGLTGAAVGGIISSGRLQAGLKTSLLSSLTGGGGVGPLGILELTDRSGGSNLNVDLSAAETIDDVISIINAAGVDITASLNEARNGITLTDTSGDSGSLVVANGDGTNTADALGVAVNASQDSINSQNLGRQTVSRQTALSALNGGNGVDLKSFVITATDGAEAAIKLNETGSEITTVGGVIDAINAAGIGVSASINESGDGIALTDTVFAAGTLSIREVGNGTTAADLHILGNAETVDIGGAPTQQIDGTARYDIDIDAEDTLQDVIDAINALDSGLVASSLFDGAGYRLSLVSDETGKANEFLLDASGTALSFNELTTAQDALLLYGPPEAAEVGVLVSSSTNQFTGLVTDLEIDITGVDPTQAVTIDVTASSGSVSQAVKSFVDSYNLVRDQLDEATFFDAASNQVGVLFGSGDALRIDNELSDLVTRQYFGVGDITTLAQIGVTVNEEGKLKFDPAKLNAAFLEDPAALEQFFTDEEQGVSARFEQITERLAGVDNSLLTNRNNALKNKIEDNGERVEFLTERLEAQRERLLLQFYRMETLVAKFQTNLSAVQGIQAIPPLTVALNDS